MLIKKEQINALEGKKQYLKKVQEWLGNRYKESKIEVPAWVYTLNSATVNLKDDTYSNTSKDFVNDQIVCCLQLLQDMRTLFYTQEQLKESQKQTCRLFWANCISFAAFVAAIAIPFLVECCCN